MPRHLPVVSLIVAVLAASAAASQSIDHGTFGPFMRSLNDTPHGYTMVEDPTGTAPTPVVERFEVRPGDCNRHPGWDDCATDRERSELSERLKTTGPGQEWWYGWSVYLPTDFVGIYPASTTLGQFHQRKSHVIWMFKIVETGYTLKDYVFGPKRGTHYLIPEADLRGRWHRIEVHARWSRGDDGFMRVWVNGKRKVDHAGPTMTAEAIYFKYGLYRGALSRYKQAKGVAEVPAQTVYYANVKRSRTREGLAATP
jgi:hypothetical protein